MSDEKKPEEPVRYSMLVYLGVRNGADTPKVHAWADVTNIPNDGDSLPQEVEEKCRIYAKRDRKGKVKKGDCNLVYAAPGAIYKFGEDDKGAVFHNPSYLGRWKNEEDVARWQAEHSSLDKAIDFRQVEDRENKQKKLHLELLDPICAAYRSAVGIQKNLIVAEVIHYITKAK